MDFVAQYYHYQAQSGKVLPDWVFERYIAGYWDYLECPHTIKISF